jgi:hypothetical protein
MIKITPRDALTRQARDIAHYAKYRPNLAAEVAAKTNIAGIDLDAELSIIEINERIPRGGSIEAMCGLDFGGD